MSKITRATMKIFGSSAGANQIEQFGSLANGTPVYQTPDNGGVAVTAIQALSNYLTGWFGGVVGANLPAIQDINAICYLYAYQLAYLMQAGVAEWDAGTTYFIGSIAQDGSGNLYTSLTNNNTGNALSSTANWRNISSAQNCVSINHSNSPYTMTSADNGKTFLFDSSTGNLQMNLPAPSANFNFKVVDVAGSISFYANQLTFHRNAAELFEGLAADYLGTAPWGTWNIATLGTNWILQG